MKPTFLVVVISILALWTFSLGSWTANAADSRISFTSNAPSITAGQSATLSWSVSGGPISATLSGGGISTQPASLPSGSFTVRPTATSDYTLRVEFPFEAGGFAEAKVTITVGGSSGPSPTPGTDTTPPKVDNIQATSITTNEATITWTTDEPATSQVEYRTAQRGFISSQLNSNRVTGHRVILSGLLPGTEYTYKVKSKDAAGNERISNDRTFTTAGQAPSPGSVGTITFVMKNANSNAVITEAKVNDRILLEFGNVPADVTSLRIEMLDPNRNAAPILAPNVFAGVCPPTCSTTITPQLAGAYIVNIYAYVQNQKVAERIGLTIPVAASSTVGTSNTGRCCVVQTGLTFDYKSDVSDNAACQRLGGRWWDNSCTAIDNLVCDSFCKDDQSVPGGGNCISSSVNGYSGVCITAPYCRCIGSSQVDRRNVPCNQACLTSSQGYFYSTPYYSSQQVQQVPFGTCTGDPNQFILSWTLTTGASATAGQYVQRPFPIGNPGDHGCDRGQTCVCEFINFGAFTARNQQPIVSLPGSTKWNATDRILNPPTKQPNQRDCSQAGNATITATFGGSQTAGAGAASATRLIQAGDSVTITGHVGKLSDRCEGYNYTCRKEVKLDCEMKNRFFWTSLGYKDCPAGTTQVHAQGDGRTPNWANIIGTGITIASFGAGGWSFGVFAPSAAGTASGQGAALGASMLIDGTIRSSQCSRGEPTSNMLAYYYMIQAAQAQANQRSQQRQCGKQPPGPCPGGTSWQCNNNQWACASGSIGVGQPCTVDSDCPSSNYRCPAGVCELIGGTQSSGCPGGDTCRADNCKSNEKNTGVVCFDEAANSGAGDEGYCCRPDTTGNDNARCTATCKSKSSVYVRGICEQFQGAVSNPPGTSGCLSDYTCNCYSGATTCSACVTEGNTWCFSQTSGHCESGTAGCAAGEQSTRTQGGCSTAPVTSTAITSPTPSPTPRTPTSDIGCTSAPNSGTCQSVTNSCPGFYLSGQCTGLSNRQCCITKGAGGVSASDCTQSGFRWCQSTSSPVGYCTMTDTECISGYASSFKVTLAKSGAGKGRIESAPVGILCSTGCSGGTYNFPAGSEVQLLAARDSTSVFAGWSGACSGTDLTCRLVMDGDKQVTATFNPTSTGTTSTGTSSVPVINRFTADPITISSGQSVALQWDVTSPGPTAVDILTDEASPRTIYSGSSLRGAASDNPTRTTIYQLFIQSGTETASKSVTVTVSGTATTADKDAPCTASGGACAYVTNACDGIYVRDKCFKYSTASYQCCIADRDVGGVSDIGGATKPECLDPVNGGRTKWCQSASAGYCTTKETACITGYTAVTSTSAVACTGLTDVSSCQPVSPDRACTSSACNVYNDAVNRYAGGAATASLLKALMYQESTCNPTRESSKGSLGLMQLTVNTANGFKSGCTTANIDRAWLLNPQNAEASICIAANYIRYLATTNCGSTARGLAAGYNGGEGACDQSNSCSGETICNRPTQVWECLYDNTAHTRCDNPSSDSYEETRKFAPKIDYCERQLRTRTTSTGAVTASASLNNDELIGNSEATLGLSSAGTYCPINNIITGDATNDAPCETVKLRTETLAAFIRMQEAAARDGITIFATSGYRNFERQKTLWNERYRGLTFTTLTEAEKVAQVALLAAVPGLSRHHWGTDIDINSATPSDFLAGGKYSNVYTWLKNNAKKYGFCQPYNVDRVVKEEPWHWSYTPLASGYAKSHIANVVPTDLRGRGILGENSIVANFDYYHRGFVYNVNPDCLVEPATTFTGAATTSPTFDVTGKYVPPQFPYGGISPTYPTAVGGAGVSSALSPYALLGAAVVSQIPVCPSQEKQQECFSVCGKTYEVGPAAAPVCDGPVIGFKDAIYNCLPGACGGYEGKRVNIVIKGPDGTTALEDFTTTDSSGDFSYTFVAPGADGEFTAIISVPKD